MKNSKTPDFFVNRLQNAVETMLIAINHYSYEEAMSVLEWMQQRVKEDSVLKIQRLRVQHDPSFPLRIPPKRRLIYSNPGVLKRKLP
ncbi:hypothetical protein [Yersinia enterocolitica]|uniref:hypothetical protein n=1 Tax=Yersinia enterocolitica TaxID=630 RepID=UPI001CA4F277|nr:hypothetical protein [Yersinia enterocolitica]MBW5835182.1 hypothetical protein [Yersinia enterocolitica]